MLKEFRVQYKFYKNNLSNFRTVLKDTKGKVSRYSDGDYNCASYAFGIFDNWVVLNAWYCLVECDNFYEISGNELYNLLEEMFQECCAEITSRFPCRQISEPEAAKPQERVIAFRIGFDDFHFARLNSDGIWTHKPGMGHIREISEIELYSEDGWCQNRRYPYVSSIAFFAITC